MGREKSPRVKWVPETGKSPRAVEGRSYNEEHPSWRIGKMEFVDPFGWHALGGQQAGAIRERLKAFETMTWNEILIQGKKRNHSVPISDPCKAARDRLQERYRGNVDIDELTSLGLTGAGRVWGIREEGVLSLLWWDPNHQVCPSVLQHT